MNPMTTARRTLRQRLPLGLALLVCAQAFCVHAQDQAERNRRYEEDRKACLSGQFKQDLESCIKEAKAVKAEPASSTATVSPEQLQRNARARCEPLKGADRADCLARMRGEGTASGSVAGGGILREKVTTEVVAPPAQAPASAASR